MPSDAVLGVDPNEYTALKKATAATAVDTAAIQDAAGKSHHVGLRTTVTRNENAWHKASATHVDTTEVLEEAKEYKEIRADAKRSQIKTGAAVKETVEAAVTVKASIDHDGALGAAKKKTPCKRTLRRSNGLADSCTATCGSPGVLTVPTTPAVAVLGETPRDAKQMKWDDRYVIGETIGCC